MTLATNNDEIVSEIQIAAKPERVFQALTDPAEVIQWWGQKGVYQATEYDADLRVGGGWHTAGDGPDGRHFVVKGTITEMNPPRVLAYTWMASWTGDAQTVVRWELSPTEAGTRVRVLHKDLAGRPELAESYRGWPRMLGWLQAFLENGETVQMRQAS